MEVTVTTTLSVSDPETGDVPATCVHYPACAIARSLQELHRKVDKIMTEQQQDVDAATAFDTQLDGDLKTLAGQVTAGQQAFDTAIANLETQIAAGGQIDTTELKAAQAVLAGDQPTLDAAVAALAADPSAAPAPAPAPAPSE
jgi:hypothetical protein